MSLFDWVEALGPWAGGAGGAGGALIGFFAGRKSRNSSARKTDFDAWKELVDSLMAVNQDLRSQVSALKAEIDDLKVTIRGYEDRLRVFFLGGSGDRGTVVGEPDPGFGAAGATAPGGGGDQG